jgi:hypothetical protein
MQKNLNADIETKLSKTVSEKDQEIAKSKAKAESYDQEHKTLIG